MKLIGLFSGGKDSTYAVWKAVQEGHEIVSLLAFSPENPDSYMFHHPNISLTKIQAEAMELPIKLVPTKGEKEKELNDLEKAVKSFSDIEGVTAGALASEYQKTRVEGICKPLGLEVYSPAWGKDPEAYWEELLEGGFRVLITKVACDGLGKEWLGHEVTKESFEKLKALAKKFRFHIAGEGGEYETFVLDCPLFRKSIQVSGKIEWDGETGVFEIEKAILNKK